MDKPDGQISSLKYGDVVQISPDAKDCFFCGCFMLVTEPKSWGAQGFISIPGKRGEMPGSAYFRATWDIMEYVGQATFIPAQEVA